MNPTHELFSLNGGASRKQRPRSSLVCLLALAVICAAGASSLGEAGSSAETAPAGRHYFFAFGKAAPGNPPVMTQRLTKAIEGVEKGINAGGNFHLEILTDPKTIHNESIEARLRSYRQELSGQDCMILYWHVHGVPKGLLLNFDQAQRKPWQWREVASAILDLPAREVIVLAMSCHSGYLIEELNGRKAAFEGRVREGRTFFVMASCRTNQLSGAAAAPAIGNCFAYAISEALQGKADGYGETSAPDGKITLREFAAYVQARTVELSPNKYSPVFTGSYQPEFVLKTVAPVPAVSK
jgi:hypothetical protein